MSWSRNQVASFAAQGAALRRTANGDPEFPAIYETRRLCVTRTSIEHRRDIEPGGFEWQPGCIVRVDMAAYPWFLPTEDAAAAAVGKLITIAGRSLKMETIKRAPLAGEIILTLGNA